MECKSGSLVLRGSESAWRGKEKGVTYFQLQSKESEEVLDRLSYRIELRQVREILQKT